MRDHAKSLRTFIGAKDFNISKQFYRDFGFEEVPVSVDMSFFRTDKVGFYLQDYYVKDWADNSMLFLEVEDVEKYWHDLLKLDLPDKYEKVKVIPIREYDWGKVCFVHDPSGVLWHIGQFY